MTTDEARVKLLQILREAGSDVSFGYAQLTVGAAQEYGIGNGRTTDLDNVLAVRRALMDRELSIDLGARHLRGCYDAAGGDWLQSLICYNSGSPHPNQQDWYWNQWASNIAAYRRAIEWAKGITDVA